MKIQTFITFFPANPTLAVALAIGITSIGWVGHWSIRIAIAIIYKYWKNSKSVKFKVLVYKNLVQEFLPKFLKTGKVLQSQILRSCWLVEDFSNSETSTQISSYKKLPNSHLYFIEWKTRSCQSIWSLWSVTIKAFFYEHQTQEFRRFYKIFPLKRNADSGAL